MNWQHSHLSVPKKLWKRNMKYSLSNKSAKIAHLTPQHVFLWEMQTDALVIQWFVQ